MVGPERASRNLERVEQKKLLTNSLKVPLKEIFQKSIEYYLQGRNTLHSKNVHNIPPREITDIANPQAQSHK